VLSGALAVLALSGSALVGDSFVAEQGSPQVTYGIAAMRGLKSPTVSILRFPSSI